MYKNQEKKPDIGVILLNPRALALSASQGGIGLTINDDLTSTAGIANNSALFKSIQLAKNFSLNSKKVYLKSIFHLNSNNKTSNFSIECGKGFYVRSLAHDLGEMLGCGAHLSELRRTKAGPFILKDAVPLEYALQCLSIGDPQKVVLDADLCIPEFPKMQLDSYQIDLIRHGRKIINDKITGEMNKDSLVRAYQNDGKFVAILKQTCNTNEWQPKKVFCS